MKLREHLHIIRRSIQLLDRLSRRNLLGRSLHALVVALMPYVPIYFSARLIDALIAGAPVQTLALYAGLTIGLTALLSLAKAFLLAQCEIGAPEMELAYEWMHAEKAAQLSYASIEDHEVARLKQRIRSETQTGFNLYYFYSSMERVIQFSVRILVSISLTASFFAADTIALPAKLLFAGGVVLTVAVNMLIGRRSAKIRSAFSADCVQSNIMLGELDGYITDYKPGKDIRLYAMEEPLAALDKRLLDELGAYEMRVYLKCAGLELIATVMKYALRFGVYLLLISGALMGGVTVGSIAQYVSSVMLLLTAVMELVRTAQQLALNDTYTRRFFSYFDIPNPMYKGSLSVEKRDDNEYYIEFCDVTFKYPNTDAYALRHVNLRFRVGEKLAVVGMNGSGKTTFIKLLCRLYDPTEGEILLNGINIRKYNYNEYMNVFSVVFQDFKLLSYTLGANVAVSENDVVITLPDDLMIEKETNYEVKFAGTLGYVGAGEAIGKDLSVFVKTDADEGNDIFGDIMISEDSLKADVSIFKTAVQSTIPDGALFIIAAYNDDETRLIGIDMEKLNPKAGVLTNAQVSLYSVEGAAKVKAFLWGADSVSPIRVAEKTLSVN